MRPVEPRLRSIISRSRLTGNPGRYEVVKVIVFVFKTSFYQLDLWAKLCRDAGLFEKFSPRGVYLAFAGFNSATGNRPIAFARRGPAFNQQNFITAKTDDANALDYGHISFLFGPPVLS
jgi:hypothetical protein